MRFKITCEIIEGDSFSQDYRRSILKLFKTGLYKYQDIFNDFFNSNKTKKYSWSVYFKNSKFEKGRIYLQDEKKEFVINFSVLNNSDSINIFNAFISIKYKEIKISEGLVVKVTGVNKLPHSNIDKDRLVAKTMSPIVCRDHNQETKKDAYYIGTDDKFTEIIKRNLYTRLKELKGEYVKKDIEDLIIDSSQIKKVVVKHYDKTKKDKTLNYENKFNGKFLDTSVGILKLEGKSYILDYIYNAGLGSITGSGFGMLEKLK